MRAAAAEAGLTIRIDSAGTGAWHYGEPPDPRAQEIAARDGVDISGLRARQVTADDFRNFDHIVAMDQDNLDNLRKFAPPDARARISLMLDHVPGQAGRAVADPYFGEALGFDATWRDMRAGAYGLIGMFANMQAAR